MKILLLIPLLVVTTALSAMPPARSVNQYISAYLPYALQEMRETGIPASVKLAMAGEESGYGTSRLAREQNNHFGITNPKPHGGMFKTYDSVKSSYEDNSVVLLRLLKKIGSDLVNKGSTDYRKWIKEIAKINYAADGPAYARKLAAHIERHNLDQYDDIRSTVTRAVKRVKPKQPRYTLGW